MLEFFWRRLRRDERGFTLIELLIVVAIIAILAAILIPNFLRARKQALVSATKGNLKNIGTALESYFVSKTQYASTLPNLTPDYILAVPNMPGTQTAYPYEVDSANNNQDYIVCDAVTDTKVTDPATVTTWYYTPSGGLGSAGATSVTLLYSSGVSVTCP